jgi:hypothetical protein
MAPTVAYIIARVMAPFYCPYSDQSDGPMYVSYSSLYNDQNDES